MMKFRAIELNKLDEKVIADIRLWRNQDFVRKNMFHTHIITEQEHREYIEKSKKDPNKRFFVLFLDDKPFYVLYYDVNPEEHTSTKGGYLIDEEDQMYGYGTISYYMSGIIEFLYLDVKKVYAEVLDTNKKALRLHDKFGFVLEKKIKDYIEIDGVKHDVYQFSKSPQMWDENSKISKLVNRFIDQEPIEDMLIL